MAHSEQITDLLQSWQAGNSASLNELMSIIYNQLHQRAQYFLKKEKSNHTLQPTALVHEAFEKLISVKVSMSDRAHLLAVCSKIMRQVLIDHARANSRLKRRRIELQSDGDTQIEVHGEYLDLLSIDTIMSNLEKLDAQKSKLAELHYFGGLTIEESSNVLGISLRTAERELRFTRSWIQTELNNA